MQKKVVHAGLKRSNIFFLKINSEIITISITESI